MWLPQVARHTARLPQVLVAGWSSAMLDSPSCAAHVPVRVLGGHYVLRSLPPGAHRQKILSYDRVLPAPMPGCYSQVVLLLDAVRLPGASFSAVRLLLYLAHAVCHAHRDRYVYSGRFVDAYDPVSEYSLGPAGHWHGLDGLEFFDVTDRACIVKWDAVAFAARERLNKYQPGSPFDLYPSKRVLIHQMDQMFGPLKMFFGLMTHLAA